MYCVRVVLQEGVLPLSVRSGEGLSLLYSVAHYSWNTQGFPYKATYQFSADRGCGKAVFSDISGTPLDGRVA